MRLSNLVAFCLVPGITHGNALSSSTVDADSAGNAAGDGTASMELQKESIPSPSIVSPPQPTPLPRNLALDWEEAAPVLPGPHEQLPEELILRIEFDYTSGSTLDTAVGFVDDQGGHGESGEGCNRGPYLEYIERNTSSNFKKAIEYKIGQAYREGEWERCLVLDLFADTQDDADPNRSMTIRAFLTEETAGDNPSGKTVLIGTQVGTAGDNEGCAKTRVGSIMVANKFLPNFEMGLTFEAMESYDYNLGLLMYGSGQEVQCPLSSTEFLLRIQFDYEEAIDVAIDFEGTTSGSGAGCNKGPYLEDLEFSSSQEKAAVVLHIGRAHRRGVWTNCTTIDLYADVQSGEGTPNDGSRMTINAFPVQDKENDDHLLGDMISMSTVPGTAENGQVCAKTKVGSVMVVDKMAVSDLPLENLDEVGDDFVVYRFFGKDENAECPYESDENGAGQPEESSHSHQQRLGLCVVFHFSILLYLQTK